MEKCRRKVALFRFSHPKATKVKSFFVQQAFR